MKGRYSKSRITITVTHKLQSVCCNSWRLPVSPLQTTLYTVLLYPSYWCEKSIVCAMDTNCEKLYKDISYWWKLDIPN